MSLMFGKSRASCHFMAVSFHKLASGRECAVVSPNPYDIPQPLTSRLGSAATPEP